MKVAVRELQTLFEAGSLGGLSDGQLLDRFVDQREGPVFEAIVRRHGPMVWGVCRRVLRDHHDAEEAFQVTFLVLARKAASVMIRQKLGNWLYGVAYQTAMKARAMKTKRRDREVQVPDMPEPIAEADELQDDLAETIDRELSRLPEKYRIPIVLCELEGRSHKEAASQLGWPIGTVSSRLSRAKSMLAKRLARRGLALSLGSLTVLLAQESASASMPTKLISTTAQAASLFAARGARMAGGVSAGVAALTTEVTKMMLLSKIKVTMAAVAAGFCLLASGVLAARLVEGNPTSDDPVLRSDNEAIQGVWTVISAFDNGKSVLRKQQIAGHRLIITDERLILKNGEGKESEITYSIDPGHSPKRINLIDERLSRNLKGIYHLNGDELKIVYDEEEGTSYPTDFVSEGGNSQNDVFLVLKRATKPDEAPIAKTEGPHRLEQRIDAIEKKLDRILSELESLKSQPPGSVRRAGENESSRPAGK